MDKGVEKEKKERTGVNIRVNDADKLYFDIWHRGVHDRKYTGLPNTSQHQGRCEKVVELILREIELGVFNLSTFDIAKYLLDVIQRRRRVPADPTSNMTFQQ